MAEDILRREPDNIGAWWVVLTARGAEPGRRSQRGGEEIQRLNPLDDSARLEVR